MEFIDQLARFQRRAEARASDFWKHPIFEAWIRLHGTNQARPYSLWRGPPSPCKTSRSTRQ